MDPNIFPSGFRQEILSTLSSTLDDPTNVRGAFISDPALIQAGKDQRYAVCMRFNARNLNRQYTGSKDRIAYFYGGHLNQLIDATQEQCGKAAYKPWPELEKYCLAKSCA
jgi:phytoene/squalene synthetase